MIGSTNLALIAFIVFYGLDWVATVPPTVALTANAFGRERVGVVFGWIFGAHRLGAAVAAWGAGAARTWLGDYQTAFVTAGLLARRVGARDPDRGRRAAQATPRALWAIPAIGVLLAFVHADAAHRIAGVPAAVSFAVVATHVAAAGAWLGCVVLAVAGPPGAARRLAPYAAGAALLAIATGSVLAIGHVRSVHELFETAYGLAVSMKLAVVVVAVTLAAAAKHRTELAAGLAALAAATVLVSLLPPV